MPASDEIIERNSDYLYTETTIRHTTIPNELMALLRSQKTTGVLTFHLSNGGVRQIILSERTKATETQRVQVREILGMNAEKP